MTNYKMHADELTINDHLVNQLILTQFPQWADLPLQRFRSAGTDNAIYRLGEKMAIRLPLTLGSAGRVSKEHTWLSKMSSLLPLPIPVPIAQGRSTESYPAPWSIYPWFESETATPDGIKNPNQVAAQLAEFITALQKIDSTHGPLPGNHNFFRGVPLIHRDAETRAAIEALRGIIDTESALTVWEKAIKTPAWNHPPVWIHGDLLPGNLLLKDGQLSAVIDFGGLGIGDPAYDLITAWCLFSAETREFFRAQLTIDNPTWDRGRGLALSIGLIALPYYRNTNPEFAKVAEHMIHEALRDDQS